MVIHMRLELKFHGNHKSVTFARAWSHKQKTFNPPSYTNNSGESRKLKHKIQQSKSGEEEEERWYASFFNKYK